MGEKDNITEDDFEKAGQTGAIDKEGKANAKKYMLKLLQKQLESDELEKPQEQY